MKIVDSTRRKSWLLDVSDLSVHFFTDAGIVKAVNNISLQIGEGEIVGLVGESGCGKSVTAHSILKLLPEPQAKITSGKILYRGDDIVPQGDEIMRHIRGNRISMIFQEPMTSLNPVYTVGDQIMESLLEHQEITDEWAYHKTLELLEQVGIPGPELRFEEYPHQLSGGMRQRVMIAMGLACKPDLLIADEPTTALDVTIQAQILRLLRKVSEESGMAVLMITHDLAVVSEICSKVAVMYASKIVEVANVDELFSDALHPYTLGLLNSLPTLRGVGTDLEPIPGSVPNPLDFPKGCKFHPRCPRCEQVCLLNEPELREVSEGHYAACHLL
jgi:oligopeptide/dipeptide ABC transporter ATP-binding protein